MSKPTETEIEAATLDRCQHPQIGDRFEKNGLWMEVERIDDDAVYFKEDVGFGIRVSRDNYRHVARNTVMHGATFIPAKPA